MVAKVKKGGSLTALMRSGKAPVVERRGFDLHRFPTPRKFDEADAFLRTLNERREVIAHVPAEHLRGFDMDGNVKGSEWRMSEAAFSDLCSFTKAQTSFVKKMACYDENLGMELVHGMIEGAFDGDGCSLVIDTSQNVIEGIVSRKYTPVSHAEILEAALSVKSRMEFRTGFLSGPNMRATIVDPFSAVEPKKGDVVRFGLSLENATNGDCSATVSGYNERLVCANGMVARGSEWERSVRHVGDALYHVQKATLNAIRVFALAPTLNRATELYPDPDQLKDFFAWVGNKRAGGTPTLASRVAELAMNEAIREHRDEANVTLWNLTNGLTEAAHDTRSIQRRSEIESMAYAGVLNFSEAWAA